MSESTRRRFLIASGTGAAAVGVAAAMPGVAGAQPVARTPKLKLPENAQSLVAHVSDPSSGTITLFLAEHEVVVHDPDLVARLARAAGSKSSHGLED
ncbi:MAG: ubiquinol-cytochrome c reductase iron-sulfur subunit N-terminal domain-containing protein [Jatrophihabitantaceae bacterium]